MKKIILFLVFGLALLAESQACSCAFFPFCQYIQHPPVKVAVQARVIRSKVYAPDNFAVYLQVLEKYKDDVAVTDTIKVYGNDFESFCYVNVLSYFPVGDTVIVAFGIFNGFLTPIVNPDSLTEHYYEVKPILCEMVKLNLQNGIVSGSISPGINACSLSDFEAGLGLCSFPVVGVREYEQLDPNFHIYPNPASDGRVYIRSERPYDPIEKIRLFSMDGRLIRVFFGLPAGDTIEMDLPGAGIYLLEIAGSGKMYYRKVMRL